MGDSGSALKQASDGLDRVKAAAQSITSVLGKIALTSAEMIAPSADLTSSSLSAGDRCRYRYHYRYRYRYRCPC